MDKIPISADDIVSLDHVAPGVAGLRILFVNVFAVATGEAEWTLIDAGLYFSGDRIRDWARNHFGNAPPQAVVLTHGHFDHVGSLRDLADGWNAPVYVHPLEMDYVTGKAEYPPPDPLAGGGSMALLSPLFPRGPIDIGARAHALPHDGSVPNMPGWRWLHTPGHTRGHVSLFREEDRTLIVGDAFCTTKQESLFAALTQRPELHGPPAYYTPDWDASRSSVEQLAALRPNAIAPGHGLPIAGPHAADELQRLADDFDRIARPQRGKYAKRGESGAPAA